MLRRIVQTGLFAGFLTALVYSLVQAVTVTPLLLQAETYEQAIARDVPGDAIHRHSDGAEHVHASAGDAAEPADPGWAPSNVIERYGATFLANVLSAIGFGFVLVAGFAVCGRSIDLRVGLGWGLAGYATFVLAPAFGLPPEVPGAAAADLQARQLWWIGTAAATAVGLGLLVFAKPTWLRLIGLVIIAVPHLIGAPQPLGVEAGPVPPELASLYVVRSLTAALVFWLLLGGSAGAIYRRLGGEARVAARGAAP